MRREIDIKKLRRRHNLQQAITKPAFAGRDSTRDPKSQAFASLTAA